jgi:hypothetical protein
VVGAKAEVLFPVVWGFVVSLTRDDDAFDGNVGHLFDG